MNQRKKLPQASLLKRKWEIGKIAIICLALIGVIVTVFAGTYSNEQEMEYQLQQNLADVATQNAAVLYSKVQANYELIRSLSKELEGVTEDEIQEKLSYFEVFLEELNLKRFAYSFLDGSTYSTVEQSALTFPIVTFISMVWREAVILRAFYRMLWKVVMDR